MSDAQRCPICKISWPSQIACCPCGFAPSAIHEFVVQLKLQRRRSVGEQVVGVLMIGAMTPLMFAFPLSIVLIPISGLTISGLVLFARGMHKAVQATRRLNAVAELRQLPAARVVER